MFMELIAKRRSIRRFTDDKVETEKIDLLKEAALRAPSSRGVNPWEFLFITNRSLLEELSQAMQQLMSNYDLYTPSEIRKHTLLRYGDRAVMEQYHQLFLTLLADR